MDTFPKKSLDHFAELLVERPAWKRSGEPELISKYVAGRRTASSKSRRYVDVKDCKKILETLAARRATLKELANVWKKPDLRSEALAQAKFAKNNAKPPAFNK